MEVDMGLGEVEGAVEEMRRRKFSIPPHDHSSALSQLEERLAYTSEMLDRKKLTSEEDIEKLKKRGVLLAGAVRDMEQYKTSQQWFNSVLSKMERIGEKEFDPLRDFRQLECLEMEEVDQFIGLAKGVKITGPKP
jgi:hypothetical protein